MSIFKNTTPLYVQIMFAQRLSYLRNFKKKNNNVWNFSCPLCNDSARDTTKARGYIYEKKGSLLYSCHNCGQTKSLSHFLKEVNPGLYAEYQLERLAAEGKLKEDDFDYEKQKSQRRVSIKEKSWDSIFYKLNELPVQHTARKYIESRKIPKKHHDRIYYTEGYQASINNLNCLFDLSIETKSLPNDARVIFPFLDKEQNLTFVQGRSLDKDAEIRYITTKVSEELKLFGYELVDTSKDIFVLEGPIDSMMLDNAVATADAALDRASYLLPKDKLVLVFDNEPRAHIGIRKMEKAIEHGFRIVVMPNSIEEKDLNQMTCNGLDVQSIVEGSIYSGARALLELNRWKKV